MLEDFRILDMSEKEHKLVMTAREKYGQVFVTLNELIRFLLQFFEIDKPLEGFIFVLYLFLTRNSLFLCLLSAVRLHQVQAALNMREALEAGARAAYALVFTERNHFIIEKSDGTLEEKNNLRGSCYDWLETNYPAESEKIKSLKNQINKFFVHAKLTTIQSIPELFEGKFLPRDFDIEDTLLVKANLLLLADITLDLIDLLAKVSSKTKIIKLITDFKRRMLEYRNTTGKIKKELMTHSRFLMYFK
jgi:hypothetical protein